MPCICAVYTQQGRCVAAVTLRCLALHCAGGEKWLSGTWGNWCDLQLAVFHPGFGRRSPGWTIPLASDVVSRIVAQMADAPMFFCPWLAHVTVGAVSDTAGHLETSLL